MGLLNKVKYKVKKVEKNLKVKPAAYDFTEYSDVEDMRGYIGFITPQGTFYRVRKLSMANGAHGEWAFAYLYTLGKRPSMIDLNANILELTDNPEYNFTILIESGDPNKPIYFCPGIKLTDAQVDVINALCNTRVLDEEVVFER